ncbi:MAG: glutamate 5-kinase [Bacteroidetes bacterium]|nr:MAG: glutamate 5-kinase [Bacteroidota bacterium]
MQKPILILKIGTASITRADGSPDEPVMVDIARQASLLHQRYSLLIVSSGAVGSGKRFLKSYSGQIGERKAAAAIGNPVLLGKYAQFFAPYGIPIAQILCERQHFSRREQFLQLRETVHTLWENGVIPIANENDVVSNLELKFSDNDELATLMAVGLGAELLLLGTSVPGVYNAEKQVVPLIELFDEQVMGLANSEKSGSGLGGMVSKLTFARLATRLGIRVVIFGVRTPEGILSAAEGKTGTLCLPQPSSLSARNRWLAGGSLVTGRIRVDEGAHKALEKRSSLLAVGILEVEDGFEKGEVVEIVTREMTPIAVARVRASSEDIRGHLQARDFVVAHADDIVLL